MRCSIAIAALSLVSSAFAITITTPSSSTQWDFSTPKTIKFTSGSSDPPVISIILRTKDGSFQTKLADNVKTADGEYTTQPNPSISNGNDYEIQIIDSAGQLAVSDTFTVEKGASNDGTASSSSSVISSSTSTSTSSTSSSTTTTTSTTTSTTSTTTTTSSSATSLSLSTSSSSYSGSTTTSSASTSSDTSSTSASATAVNSNGAASSRFSAPKGAMALFGATLAFFYV